MIWLFSVGAFLFSLLPLPLIVLANFADQAGRASPAPAPLADPGSGVALAEASSGQWPGDVKRGTSRGAWPSGLTKSGEVTGLLTWLALLLLVLGFILTSLLTVAVAALAGGSSVVRHVAGGGVAVGTGAVAAAVLFPAVRRLIARAIPIDPGRAVHLTALVLVLLLFGTQLAAGIAVDLVALQGQSGAALQADDLLAQEVPFVLVALCGVGLWIRRDGRASLLRLGLVRPRLWHVLLALAVALLFYAFASGVDALSNLLTPDLNKAVQKASERLFGHLAASPVGIAAIAVTAGVCEELFFRGALQPRLGLIATSVLFASVHSQYGLSLTVLAVLILSLALGFLRRYLNTTTSALCHVAYDGLASLSITGAAIWLIGGGLELLLLGGAVSAWFFTRRVGAQPLAS
ncbi:MAG: CPBP family intramembrane metalloprotease [Candidatus Dormibacteraeota bacterium]|nr:CPBP family intramembrane metalloprotease [Candidatus Dormibacteraeota bacterium]